MSRVFDVFPFFNEIDLLEIRLNELDSVVDFFVITEASTTFSGLEKPFYFELFRKRFEHFSSKILYQKIENVPDGLSPFERDWFQRDAAKSFLEDYILPDDFIVYGDVDEIPKAESITYAQTQLSSTFQICHCAMDLYYYYLNLREDSGTLLSYMGEYPRIKNKKWIGTTISKWGFASGFTLTQLRNPEHKSYGIRIDDAGWHFSYVGGFKTEPPIDRIVRKIQSAAHQELNNDKVLRKVEKRLLRNKDVFGRRRSKFSRVQNLTFLPTYVLQNLVKFEHLVLE